MWDSISEEDGPDLSVCLHVCVCVCVCVCLQAKTYIQDTHTYAFLQCSLCASVYIHTVASLCESVCLCVCVYVCVRARVCVCINPVCTARGQEQMEAFN